MAAHSSMSAKITATSSRMSSKTSSIKADVNKSLTPQSLLAATSTAGTLPLELRCFKHSPRVARKAATDEKQISQFEAEMWQRTFDSMGVLQQLNLKEFSPFTTLNKAPYHCVSKSQNYKVSHGKISHLEGASVKGSRRKSDAKTLSHSAMEPIALPEIQEKLNLSTIIRLADSNTSRKNGTYVPKSCVLVWWNHRRYDVETICEWLQRFGLYIVTTIYKGANTLTICFDTIKSAFRAVNYPQSNLGIRITWYDVKLYNYGYFRKFENYAINKDAEWKQHRYQKMKGTSGTRELHMKRRNTKMVAFF